MTISFLQMVVILLSAASTLYLLVACYAVINFNRIMKKPHKNVSHPPVSIMKPIYGIDYQLKENLLSFCRLSYPDYQIVFGVQHRNDPAIAIIHQVMAECPDIQTMLVIEEELFGPNRKVSNLMHMEHHAIHDILLISDSDMVVKADYLSRVISSFDRDFKGLVTCLYKATSAPGFASTLGAMFINQWFLPSALIPATFAPMKNCFGATMAIHRQTLNEIGGLKSLVNNLADDYMLGKRVQDAGHPIMLAPVLVENRVQEKNFKALFYHELRWARTIRSVEPLGYASTFLTDTLVWGTVASMTLWTTSSPFWSWAPISIALLVRFIQAALVNRMTNTQAIATYLLIPARDLLSFLTRIVCYMGHGIRWRDDKGHVRVGGQLTTEPTRHKPPEI